MKRIAVISFGYLWFPCESGPSRFFYIAKMLHGNGYEVECITTGYQHFKKQLRDKETILKQNYPFDIVFIDSPPYKKNIDLKRVYSNAIAAKRLKKYLEANINRFDAVYVSIPANNIAAMVTTLCKKNGIPVIVDIEDLWPEAMSMVVKSKTVRSIALRSFYNDAEKTYQQADAIIGTSEDYTERAFRHREKNIPFATVYVGCNLSEFDDGVKRYAREIEKADEEFWVTYAGSISTSYDIRTLIDAGRALKDKNIHIQILGDGSLREELESYSKNDENIHFRGYMEYSYMAAFLSRSDILINSIIKKSSAGIVNKIGDYLAASKPMINTLENPSFCDLVSSERVGINIDAEDPKKLEDAILCIYEDDILQIRMGNNARSLAERRFDRRHSYREIVKLVDSVI